MISLKDTMEKRIKIISNCFGNESINKLLNNDYQDVKKAVLKLIQSKKSLMFSEEELDDDDWGQERLRHNKNIEADIRLIKEIMGDWKE